ncbi:MAG: hypothetical protein HKN07_14195 [Acidimicrobiia bacterium]|nr:cell wall-binding repeat-containing protein [Acidimicrobiia bacterium]NNF65393.1 hypothetical protein [Acidimicrobiia bacterium]
MRIAAVSRVVALVAVVVTAATAIYTTQVEASGSTTDVVFVATGNNFPDALGAAAAGGVSNAPVLLVTGSILPAPTRAELERLKPSRIIVVGGTGVVSEAVVNSLKGLTFKPTVDRVSGADRYETAAALSAAVFPASVDADTLDGLDSSDFARAPTTMRGVYMVEFDATDNFSTGASSFSYPFELPTKPTAHFVPSGSIPPPECPGNADQPEALPGHLCVYEKASENHLPENVFVIKSSRTTGVTDHDRFGAGVFVIATLFGTTYNYGTWAVTMP